MGEGKNRLYYGDNLEVLRRDIPDESVDLIYLDPPFNSNRNYNILFKKQDGTQANAQIQAFDDTWSWSQDDEVLYLNLIGGTGSALRVADAVAAFHKLLGPSDMMSYLVMMAVRLLELHRVLKPTGSLYLHCDPVASHYLKILLDAIFGPEQFRNEVVWKRTGAHGRAKRWGPVHDTLLFYSMSDRYTWNRVYEAYDPEYLEKFYRHEDEHGRYRLVTLDGPGVRTGPSGQPWRGVDPTDVGRHWEVPPDRALPEWFEHPAGYSDMSVQERLEVLDAAGLIYWPSRGVKPQHKRYLDAAEGNPVQDIISDIRPIASHAAERLGYPTQKPLALLERIIEASSNEGDVVLDPFCGCGTAVDAAQRLRRKWIGIDITWLAVDLIDSRMEATYGPEIKDAYTIHGIPTDLEGARALFQANPFDFERWVVSFVDGHPNQKQVGDKGVDGIVRFWETDKTVGEMVVSVKGGATVNPAMVRELEGTVLGRHAEMGLLITLTPPTAGMIERVNQSGTYTRELTGKTYPKVQIITVEELFDGKRPKMPEPINPYIQAKHRGAAEPLRLFADG